MRVISFLAAFLLVAVVDCLSAAPSGAHEPHVVLCKENVEKRDGRCKKAGIIRGGKGGGKAVLGQRSHRGEAVRITFNGKGNAVPRISCATAELALKPDGNEGVGDGQLPVRLTFGFANCKTEDAKDPVSGSTAQQVCVIAGNAAQASLTRSGDPGDGQLKTTSALQLGIVCPPQASRPLLNCAYAVAPGATLELDGAANPSVTPAPTAPTPNAERALKLEVAKNVNGAKANCGNHEGGLLSATYRGRQPAWVGYVIKCGNTIVDSRLLLAPCQRAASAWVRPSA